MSILAVLSTKCGMFIKKELQLECTHATFWTKVALGYITTPKGPTFL